MKPSLILLGALAVAVSPLVRADDEAYQPVPVAELGTFSGESARIYVPAPLTSAGLPHSLALVAVPGDFRPAGEQTKEDAPAFSRNAHHTRVQVRIPKGTSLYGEGEVAGPLLRNGTETRLWNTDNYAYQRDNGRRLYESHPWVLAVRPDGTAFGVIADSTYPCTIELKDGIDVVSDGPAFPVEILEGESPRAVVEELGRLTGLMPLPPRWAIGYQQCRYSYHPDTEVKEIADQFRRRQIPCDVIWMDIHYMDGYRIFTFDPKEFPDPKGVNDYLHGKGFHSVWMIDPGVKAEKGYFVYDSGTAQNVWVQKTQGGEAYHGSVWPGDCVFPDFTRPETRAWWGGLYKDFLATGVDGIWNDMNEPAVFNGPDKTMALTAWHRGGGDLPAGPHVEYHNVYGRLMVEASRAGIQKANPDKRPFVLSRANYLGGQRFAATWTGDNESSARYLNAAIPMSLNLSMSGQPFNGPDLGGFGGNATGELWSRWVGFGAFFPFCRAHASVDTNRKEPWAFGPEVEKVAKTAIGRRYVLLPYLYTLFHEASVSGSPVMQPVFFADPANPALRAVDSEFLLGSDLSVSRPDVPAPVLDGWQKVELLRGEATVKDQAIVRIRPGAIVPTGALVQDTGEDSFSQFKLLVCLDRDGKAEGSLYEDAGDGYGYKTGDFRVVTFHAERTPAGVRVTMSHLSGDRVIAPRPVTVAVVSSGSVREAAGTDANGVLVP